MPITPITGSLFHADTQASSQTSPTCTLRAAQKRGGQTSYGALWQHTYCDGQSIKISD